MNFDKIKIGIVQGRLSRSNFLHVFPKNPFKEFNDAKKLGFDFIELLAERKINKLNPIWNNDPELFRKIIKKNKMNFFSACDDYIILKGLNSGYLKYLESLLSKLSQLKIKRLILPMEGKAQIKEKELNHLVNFFKSVLKLCKKYEIPTLLIESNCNYEIYKKIKKKVNSKNLFFLYDLGNRSLYYKNVFQDILKFNDEIKQIHIKDKDSNNVNVQLGTGDVKFVDAFRAIKKISNKDLVFVFEHNKGKNPLNTAKKNFKFIYKIFQSTQ
jgi:sugar phosphate isomerase/epimerase